MDWLRLIRWKNLLIVFFTQLLVWYSLIYDSTHFGGLWAITDFLPLAVSTVLIAAAGYIINDYFDIKIDIINRPEKVVLEKKIPLKTAIIAHTLLNIAGMLLAGFVAVRAHHVEWLLVQVVCITLLWFYSTDFKKQFITGNVVVALLTALTILVLQVYEPGISSHLRLKSLRTIIPPVIKPAVVLYSYAFFAFMLTWMREIVKDMEDYIGDAEEGCVTMPIKMGLPFSTSFIRVLGAITLLCLGGIVYYLYQVHHTYLATHVLATICIPLAGWCIFIGNNNTTAHYHTASNRLKIIMIVGIGSLLIYYTTNNLTP